ncbi:hypothetical protein EDB89DRAFT_1914306 [Lactarius sanguifluus]|nr:hypothetical protein EDB89DRAFT_1914306 [Lactarius sanguifluus]
MVRALRRLHFVKETQAALQRLQSNGPIHQRRGKGFMYRRMCHSDVHQGEEEGQSCNVDLANPFHSVYEVTEVCHSCVEVCQGGLESDLHHVLDELNLDVMQLAMYWDLEENIWDRMSAGRVDRHQVAPFRVTSGPPVTIPANCWRSGIVAGSSYLLWDVMKGGRRGKGGGGGIRKGFLLPAADLMVTADLCSEEFVSGGSVPAKGLDIAFQGRISWTKVNNRRDNDDSGDVRQMGQRSTRQTREVGRRSTMTRRVVDLTGTAEGYREMGHDERKSEKGRDEFSCMAWEGLG